MSATAAVRSTDPRADPVRDRLAAALARRPPPDPEHAEWASRLSLGPHPAGALPFAEIAAGGPALERCLADVVHGEAGADDKLAAAYLMGHVGHGLADLLAGLWLGGAALARVPPEAVAFAPRWVPWEDDEGRERLGVVHDLALDARAVTPMPEDAPSEAVAEAFQDLFEALHAPLVERLHARSRLSRGALWRLVGDGLTASMLEWGKGQGKASGEAERAMALARGIVGRRGRPLHSRQTGFVLVTLPEGAPPETALAADWFRARGGCCRYYTTPGGEYCTTCVLRPPQSRDARLRNHLAERLAKAALR